MEKKMESTTIEDESSMMTTTIVKGRAKGAGGGKIRHRNILRTQKQIKEFFNFISNIHTHTQIQYNGIFFLFALNIFHLGPVFGFVYAPPPST